MALGPHKHNETVTNEAISDKIDLLLRQSAPCPVKPKWHWSLFTECLVGNTTVPDLFDSKADFLQQVILTLNHQLTGSEPSFLAEISSIIDSATGATQKVRKTISDGTSRSEQDKAGILSIFDIARQQLWGYGFHVSEQEIALSLFASRVFGGGKECAHLPLEQRFDFAISRLEDDLAFYGHILNSATPPTSSSFEIAAPGFRRDSWAIHNISVTLAHRFLAKKTQQRESHLAEADEDGQDRYDNYDRDEDDSGSTKDAEYGHDQGHTPQGTGQSSFDRRSARNNMNPSNDGSYSWNISTVNGKKASYIGQIRPCQS